MPTRRSTTDRIPNADSSSGDPIPDSMRIWARSSERSAASGSKKSSSTGDLLDILEHPNPERYAGERILVVQREDYVYLVPFVEDEQTVFLKTIIPSRKATKQYLGEEYDDEA